MLVIVLLVSFFLLLFIGVPISFALSISSFTAVMTTGAIPVINLVQKTFRAIDSFTLLAIPFFVFAGNVMARGGVSKRLTDMAATLVGRMPGGLAHVATLSSTFFGAISGSAPATTSAIGAVMVPEMEKRNYDKAFTAAVVAASGTIGLIIPPSNTMVMYGTLANASVGKMFIGGVGPGLQHGGGGGGVGPHGDDFRGKPRGLALAHQSGAHAPALAVDDEKFFLFHSRLLSI